MSTSPLSITLWGPTAFSISMIMIATPFVLYYTQTSTMYTITPSGCDAATYANQSSWYTGPWVIIPAYGVCPVETYSYTEITGYAYNECMDFNSKSQWLDLDAANEAEGYRTYMSAGAVVWARSDEFLVVGTVCLFLIPFAIIGFGSADDDEQILVIFTLLAAVPIALFVTLEMFLTVQRTDQIQPEAWALVMFKTCDVTVRTTYGIYLVMYVIAVCGVLVLTSYGLLAYFGYKEYRKFNDEQTATFNTVSPTGSLDEHSTSGRTENANPLLVSRSWYYGRTAARGAAGGSRGEESESLLSEGAGREELKTKEDTKLYQTAIEYRVDRADYYPLPYAPAASYTHDGD